MKVKWKHLAYLELILWVTFSVRASASDITLTRRSVQKEKTTDNACKPGRYSGVKVDFDGTTVKFREPVSKQTLHLTPEASKRHLEKYYKDEPSVSWIERECLVSEWMVTIELYGDNTQGQIGPEFTNQDDKDLPDNDLDRAKSPSPAKCATKTRDTLHLKEDEGGESRSLRGRIGDEIEFQASDSASSSVFRALQLGTIVIGDCR